MDVQNLGQVLRSSRRIACLLGLHVASDCGCFDYRDSENAYAIETHYGYSPEEIFSAAFYNNRPKLFFEYYHKEILDKLEHLEELSKEELADISERIRKIM